MMVCDGGCSTIITPIHLVNYLVDTFILGMSLKTVKFRPNNHILDVRSYFLTF